jgi:dTDP-4-amino-4,6-dideoxygalactose transaminase
VSLIPVMRPLLPQADQIFDYLKRIDANRHYSNFGPLVRELESRLEERYGTTAGSVCTVCNTTAGITAALLAQNVPQGSLCAMPSWTFIATPLAAERAGLTPWFVDVDEDSWATTPDGLAAILDSAPGDVRSAVIVVPFGRPIDLAAWTDFSKRTGITVVIDAAAGFDALEPCPLASVVSLHATKVIGAGEGGFLLSTDLDLVARVKSLISFGFRNSRLSEVSGMNAKMSEYSAAVALAALDIWPETRSRFVDLAKRYADGFQRSNAISLQEGFGSHWVSSTLVLRFAHQNILPEVEAALDRAEVQYRHWWGQGSHRHPSTEHLPCADLATTDILARSTIGVPFHLDLSGPDIDRIVDVVQRTAET